MTGFAPTAEQLHIADLFREHGDVRVRAGAGTGKTSTVIQLADIVQAEGQLGLYLAFNKSIATEAGGKFPKCISALTSHALAYKGVRNSPQARVLDKLGGRKVPFYLTARKLRINGLSVTGSDGRDRWLDDRKIARHAIATVDRWCKSADPEMTVRHVPRMKGLDGDRDYTNNAHLADAVLPYAHRIWADLLDPRGDAVAFGHGAYLKMWALSNPRLGRDGAVVFLDEAQDTAPVLAGVLDQQTHLRLVAVGDQAQRIYCQPVGTKVTVPRKPESGCEFGKCPNPRMCANGLCAKHERHRLGGMIEWSTPQVRRERVLTEEVPIESLEVGDLVSTYDNTHVYKSGRKIKGITRFKHDGQLVRVSLRAGELTSAYTPKHHCIVRLGAGLDGKHVVYLMRKGDQFRIGRVPAFYGTQANAFGLKRRAVAEGADAAWILSVHDSVPEASLHEALTQHAFNIPGLCFVDHKHEMDVAAFWSKIGPNLDAGVRCLTAHGRLLEFPLVEPGSSAGRGREFVTAAANLISGMTMLPLDRVKQFKGKRDYVAPGTVWETIAVTREYYEGDIVSLEIEDHHTYFGDGILTHNSFTGATDYMVRKSDVAEGRLTKSWRFGPVIAEAANSLLERLGDDLRLTGNEALESTITPGFRCGAVLCRTNGGALEQVMAAQQAGKRVHLLADTQYAVRFCDAADRLKSGEDAGMEDLAAFTSWGEVQEYAEQAEDAAEWRTLVRLIDDHGTDDVRAALGNTIDERRADVVISTAHKSKGREFSSVKLHSDIAEFVVNAEDRVADAAQDADPAAVTRARAGLRDELMLAYVAVTRAMHVLDPGELLKTPVPVIVGAA